MDWTMPNTVADFKMFRERLELYFQVRGITESKQVPLFLLQVGEEGLEWYNTWTLTDEQQQQPAYIFNCFLEQMELSDNFRICRLELRPDSLNLGESLEAFITRCKLLSQKCDFSSKQEDDRLIEQIIASAQISDFQKELLTKPKTFTLDDALDLGWTYETSATYLKQCIQ